EDFARAGKYYRGNLDIRIMTEKVAGGSFEEFFQKYVSGTAPFPYEQILALAGLQLNVSQRKRAALGFVAEREANVGLLVRGVDEGGGAAKTGLRSGDVILKWNG